MGRVLLGAQSYLMLIGACNPMLCQIWVFRWCDYGHIGMGLWTDTQHMGYVLKPGEARVRPLDLGLMTSLSDRSVLTVLAAVSGRRRAETPRLGGRSFSSPCH